MNKTNFRCPRCKKGIRVGKHLHAVFECPMCHAQMVIDREERANGRKKYQKNFYIYN